MIEIVPYNPVWPVEYERIAAALDEAIGDLAVRIDHIGSTAVPGLAAKDLIDVQVSVKELSPELENRLEAVGYRLRKDIPRDHRPPRAQGPDSDWEKRFFQPPLGQRPTNLHVRLHGRANQRYPLLFRDYLRLHPAAAEAYAEVKRRLAYYLPEDRLAYTEIKDPVCDLILGAAEAWAEATGWDAPGPEAYGA